ncbi:hypothetical protein GCM10022224_034690 [Nonomuraea antimicrobica]|uniref:Uncharacterized protein n=1 Tax=Nonomuraea antimicrobica TaxID=561173 RepID=A0ABP7BSJ0_9ACTN
MIRLPPQPPNASSGGTAIIPEPERPRRRLGLAMDGAFCVWMIWLGLIGSPRSLRACELRPRRFAIDSQLWVRKILKGSLG